MIRYALICHDCACEFDAWFSTSSDFDIQKKKNLISCIQCHGHNVDKGIMAPAVKGTKKTSDAEPNLNFGQLAAMARQHVSNHFEYVGDDFANEARAMHFGETEYKSIWGETTPDEQAALKEEGITANPLHPAFVPAIPQDKDKLN